mmetsp:Transcript_15047/g.33659  ORF Transcript_15047/g.33659 Transcript_15047/m.33659 type:complete len:202 (-) Transcript_15047:206-811(-)
MVDCNASGGRHSAMPCIGGSYASAHASQKRGKSSGFWSACRCAYALDFVLACQLRRPSGFAGSTDPSRFVSWTSRISKHRTPSGSRREARSGAAAAAASSSATCPAVRASSRRHASSICAMRGSQYAPWSVEWRFPCTPHGRSHSISTSVCTSSHRLSSAAIIGCHCPPIRIGGALSTESSRARMYWYVSVDVTATRWVDE